MASSHEMDGRWVHFVETVYGAWLYGDARGFRTRHHILAHANEGAWVWVWKRQDVSQAEDGAKPTDCSPWA